MLWLIVLIWCFFNLNVVFDGLKGLVVVAVILGTIYGLVFFALCFDFGF